MGLHEGTEVPPTINFPLASSITELEVQGHQSSWRPCLLNALRSRRVVALATDGAAVP